MRHDPASLHWAVLAALLALQCVLMPPTKAQTLFDAELGALPQAQGWVYAAIGPASGYLTNSAALLDTTPSTSTYAGWSEIAPTDLNRTNGFSLRFTARVDIEAHSSTNRAGFSVIVLGNDAHGLELGFWNNKVFVQTDAPLFTHGEDVAISTTNTFVNFSLSFFPTNYLLAADGEVILTGPVRNYTAYDGPFNVYSTPNFLFMGDDTASASGRAEIRNVSLISAPRLFINPQGVVSWTGVSNQLYQLQISSDLVTWSNGAAVTSTTTAFSYTNSGGRSLEFYRVVAP